MIILSLINVRLIKEGMSLIFGEIESFASLLERAIKLFKRRSNIQESKEELVSTRLINAFQAHGVHRNQVPRVLGYGLTLKDVKSDEYLLEKLDEQIISSACTMLGINRGWLEGASEEVYDTYRFYKKPKEFESFLLKLLGSTEAENISGVLLAVDKKDREADTILLLQETIGSINGKEFYRYYICSGWVFSYWKSRAYLTACVAICWKNSVFLHGKYTDSNFLGIVSEGKSLLRLGSDGICSIKGNKWYAEDLALNPEVYLEGVDPKVDNFGIISALSLWLEIDNKGLLDCGLPNARARSRFEYKLEELSQ